MVQLNEGTARKILGHEGGCDPLQIQRGLGHMDEEQLQIAVREGDTIRGGLQNPTRRGSVGHRAKGKIPLDAPSVGEVKDGVAGLYVGDVLDPSTR